MSVATTRTAFLWGGHAEAPLAEAFYPRSTKWWTQYATQLKLSNRALEELRASSRAIVSLLPDPLAWEDSPRPYTGMVVGAVQSGKTASMIGVAAVALDQGYRIIVVLAGSKDDLRQQTARRFNMQLLRQRDPIQDQPGLFTLSREVGNRPSGGFAPPYYMDSHQCSFLWIEMAKALSRGEPVVVVVKKNTASLADLRSKLLVTYDRFGIEHIPMLVLDDECDDASVDSAERPIPSAIANLWYRSSGPSPLAAYVGYTATAAANLLQPATNELYPRHFVTLLRYPGRDETALSFAEPSPDGWYTGGESFYEEFGDIAGDDDNYLIREVQDGDPEDAPGLADAIRAFLTAGAIRLALDPDASFFDGSRAPQPHTMMVQTSPLQNEHMRWMKAIQARFGGIPSQGNASKFDAERILNEIHQDESPWKSWFDSFMNSRERLYQERPHERVQKFVTWEQVKEQLPRVLENVRLKVLNSDPGSSGNLDFERRANLDGSIAPPQDIYTVIVGGARLSRGLTIEGLGISYFTRWNPSPTEDTILQLGRWFGYRGPYLEFCRLFTTRQIYSSLREINRNDIDLRHQLAELMAARQTPGEAALILRASPHARPTSKMGIGKIHDLAFSPFETVFRDVECGALSLQNQSTARLLVDKVIARAPEEVRTGSGIDRGLLSRGWSIEEVADLLDTIGYSDHNPGERGNPGGGAYRDPDPSRPICYNRSPATDPYLVAAYLRQWAQVAAAKHENTPVFNVGVAFGEIAAHTEPFNFGLLNRSISQDMRLESSWTGRSANWRGDAFFDQPDPMVVIPGSALRRAGADGLLLLYIVHRDAEGRKHRGIVREYHTPTFGIVIPDGGPQMRRVTVDQTSPPDDD